MMKKLALIVIATCLTLGAIAQNKQTKLDDFGRIALASYVPDYDNDFPMAAKNILATKLGQIVTDGGLGTETNERFIITANVNVLAKEIVSSAPTMVAYNLDITFYIGDGVDGTKFASTSLNIKGVGENETKAYINAIKTINTKNTALTTFLENGKAKILKYYNSNCDLVIGDAQSLAAQGRYEEAFYKLAAIPSVSRDCYNKARTLIVPFYKKYNNKICQTKLMEARTVWAASQNYEAAVRAGEIIAEIDASSVCYKEVKTFVDEMAKTVKERENKAWSYAFAQQKLNADVSKAAYTAAAAYAGRQQNTVVYNVRGWW